MFVEIKNLCDFDERSTEGVTRPEAVKIYDTLKEVVPNELRPHVGEIGLRGLRNFNITVLVCKGLEEILGIRRATLSLASSYYNGRKLRVACKVSPGEKKRRELNGWVKNMLEVEVPKHEGLSYRVFWAERCLLSLRQAARRL